VSVFSATDVRQAADGSAGAPGMSFAADPDTGIYRLSDGTIGFSINGAVAMQMRPQGGGGYYLDVFQNSGSGGPLLIAAGPGANASMSLIAKGAGALYACTSGGTANIQLKIEHTALAVDYVQVTGSPTGGTQPVVTVSAQGADANVGLALVPLGTGGLSAARPDGATTGGNARGNNAVDWQQVRATSLQVASSVNSVIGGGANNTVSGSNGVVAGGSTNAVTAGAGWVPGGQQATTTPGVHRGAWSAGRFSTISGTAQEGFWLFRAATADATPVRLLADMATGATPSGQNSFNIADGTSYAVRGKVVARDQAGANTACWFVDLLVERNGATTVVGGGGAAIAPSLSTGTASAWRLAIAADSAVNGVNITGTGAAATSIRWVASMGTAEVGTG
jgi:hypothetical protein